MDLRHPLHQAIASALAGILFLNPLVAAAAQLTVDAAAGGNTQIGAAGNGVPVVNIATPNGAGLSHNKFSDYNVGQQGVILNNATGKTQDTQLGGIVVGNPNLKGQAAQKILNEVTGGSRSQLQGYTEVAGQGAHVIVANPNGVTCNGCGFINTPRATLSTGTPIVNGGRLQGYDVNGGDIAIEGAGLNASNIDQFELITRSAKLNADLHAKQLTVVTGRNQVDAQTLNATAKPDDGSGKPQLAIDSSALGGMYAGAIRLVGTEQGVGVKLAGNLAANAGDIQIDANGQLSLAQTASAGSLRANAQDIALQGPAYAAGSVALNAAGQLSNSHSLAAGQRIDLRAAQLNNSGIVEAGVNPDNSRNVQGDVAIASQTLRNSGSVVASRNLDVTASATLDNQGGALKGNAARVAAGTLDNRQGRVIADTQLSLSAARLDNRSGQVVARDLQVGGGHLDNRLGLFSAEQALSLDLDSLDNSGKGTLVSNGTLQARVKQTLDNRGEGVLSAKGDLAVQAGSLDNRGGALVSDGAVGLSGGRVDNSAGGTVSGKQGLSLAVNELANGVGGTLATQGELRARVQGALDNHGDGALVAGSKLDVSAGSLNNQGGLLSSNGQLVLASGASDNRNGKVLAQGRLDASTGHLDNRGGVLSGQQGLVLRAGDIRNGRNGAGQAGGLITSQGALDLRVGQFEALGGGEVSAKGDLQLTVATLIQQQALLIGEGNVRIDLGQAGQRGDFDNRGGLLSAGGLLQINGLGHLDNRGGEISSAQSFALKAGGTLDNGDQGRLISGGQLSLDAAALRNANQGLLSGWQGLSVNAASLDNSAGGTLSSRNGALDVTLSGALDNRDQGALVSQGKLTLAAGSLNNAGGIVSTQGDLGLSLAGNLDNRTGGLLSAQGALTGSGAALDNRGGQINGHAVQLTGSSLDNSGGSLSSQGALRLSLLGALLNVGPNAKLASAGPLHISAGSVDNRGGQLVSQSLLQVLAGRFDNSAGGTLASQDALVLSLSGALLNRQDGLIFSKAGTLDIGAVSLDNAAGTLQGQLDSTLRIQGAAGNQGGHIVSQAGNLDLHSASLDNGSGGILNSAAGWLKLVTGWFGNHGGTTQAQALDVQASGGIDNRNGHLSAVSGDNRIVTSDLNNQGGGLYAGGRLSVSGNQLFNQGGKVGAGSLDFSLAGALNNQAGLIESSGSLNIRAASLDNRGGAIRALGQAPTRSPSLMQIATSGLLDNSQGRIEGATQDFGLYSAALQNAGGSVLHVGSGAFALDLAQAGLAGGSFTTNGGLSYQAASWTNHAVIQARDFTLNVGTLVQGSGGQLLAVQNFSGSGGNWNNDGLIASDGSLGLTLGGSYTGNGRLSSLGNLALGAGYIGLGANTSIAGGATTTVNSSGSLDNHGRLTSAGDLQVGAGTLNNYGTLGSADRLRVVAGNLLNQGGLLFSGGDMALRVGSFTNRYADVYSLGSLDVAADDAGNWAARLDNLSGTLTSEGDMRLNVGTLNNQRVVLVVDNAGKYTAQIIEVDCYKYLNDSIADCSGKRNHVWEITERDKLEVLQASAASSINAGGNLSISSDSLNNASSVISAGQNIYASVGTLTNQGVVTGETETFRVFKSERTRDASSWVNEANAFTDQYWIESPNYVNDPQGLANALSHFISTTETDLPQYGTVTQLGSDDQTYAGIIQAGGNVSITARNEINNSVIRNNYSYVNPGQQTANTGVGASGVQTVVPINAQLPPELAQQHVNPLTLPGFSLPQGQNGLFRLSGQGGSGGSAESVNGAGNGALAGTGNALSVGGLSAQRVQGLPSSAAPSNSHKYLIETNPELTSLKSFLSSDYLLGLLGYDPDKSQKRLGDGLYEQRLLQQAVVARTGQRFIDGMASDEALFKHLMDNAIAYKDKLQLSLGVGLSAEQVAALTHDIVWMEEAVVNGEKVLVPVLYLAQSNNRLAPNGALIQGQDVSLISGGELNNAGTLRASNNLSATASNLSNSGLVEAGNRLDLLALDSIRNSAGGIISGRDVSLTALTGDVLNERSVTRIDSAQGNRSWTASFADSAARIEAAGHLDISAGRDISNLGGVLQSRGDLAMSAGRDVNIASVQVVQGQVNGSRSASQSVQQLGAQVSAGRDLDINAGRDLTAVASQLNAGRDALLSAGRDVTLASAANESHRYGHTKKVTAQEDHVQQQGTSLNAGGNAYVAAGQDLTLQASTLSASGEAYLYGARDVNLVSAQDSDYSYYRKTKTSSSGLSSSSKTTIDSSSSTTQVGSLVSADSVAIRAGQDIGVRASDVVSTHGTSLLAGRNVVIDGATDTFESSHAQSKKKSGVMSSGGLGFSVGTASTKATQTEHTEQTRGSTLGSVLGNVDIQAGKDLTIRGSDVVAGRDINLIGQNVSILAAQNENRSEQTHKSKSSGLTLALSGSVGSAMDAGYQTAKQAREEDDNRLAALQGIKAGLTGVQALQAAQQGGMTAANAEQFFGVSASLGSQKSSSKQTQEQSVSQGSSLTAGNSLNILATGAGKVGEDGDIRIQGSQLKAGNDMLLAANRDITLEAAANTQKLDGKNSSSGGSIGASVGAGPQGAGLSIFASANQGSGKEKGNGTTWSETTLDAGDRVSLISGRDTTLKGAQVSGEQIIANVGRDLTLQSLQDSDYYESKQKNVSAGGSVNVVGAGGGGANLSASQSQIDSHYKSVQEQTGLYAGKGGFQIEVGNQTQLDGSVIASTADADKNRLSTGTLGWSSLDNKADYTSQQQSVSLSSGNTGSGEFVGNLPSGMLVPYNHGDSASGTTNSAISNGTLEIRDKANQQQDVASLSRDVEHANGSINPIFDKEKEQQRLQQVQLISEIGTQAMDIVRTQGEIKAEEAARKELANAGNRNPTADEIRNSAIYQLEMSRYGTGSDYQKAAQAVTAALQGLVGGDIGSALAGASAPYLAGVIKAQAGDNDTARLMAHAVLGALVAQAQGNAATAGAAGAFTGEALAPLIAQQLYGKSSGELSESEKQAVVALSSLAGGLAGGLLEGDFAGAVAAGKAGQNTVENNEFGGRVYADRMFEAYVQGGGCGGAARQQCRQEYENKELANGGLEVALAFSLLPVAIVGAASTPAVLAAARVAVEACKRDPILCVNETSNAVGSLAVGEALPAGLVGTAGVKLTLEQAQKVRIAQEVEKQMGQKLSADAYEAMLGGVPKGAAPVVTAEGKIGSSVFTDVNQTARPAAQANPNQPTLISDRIDAKTATSGKIYPNGNMADAHAEIGVIQKAFSEGKTAGSDMSMTVVGKDVCGYCRGDIAAAADKAGLKSLTVQAKDDITGLPKTYYWEPGMKSIREKQ
ncbi:hemagglutinin repeat-containing protein [Pseudomonas sp. QL9]|uniref:hemagglutinin repeat-containing protein n=1 Tax=Pseudomonas sp. QL9 TaxID=3242725 RepID=UPI00352B4731